MKIHLLTEATSIYTVHGSCYDKSNLKYVNVVLNTTVTLIHNQSTGKYIKLFSNCILTFINSYFNNTFPKSIRVGHCLKLLKTILKNTKNECGNRNDFALPKLSIKMRTVE